MGTKAQKKAALAGNAPSDLQDVVLEAIRAAGAIKASKLNAALPKPYQRFKVDVGRALDEIVERGKAWRRTKGKVVSYFADDPIHALDELLLKRLPQTFDQAGLSTVIKELAPDYEVVLKEWLESALARRLLFEHAPAKGSKKPRFGRQPDVSGVVAPLMVALRKVLPKTESLGVPRRRIVELVMAELGLTEADLAGGLPRAPNGKHAGSERDGFLSALKALTAENPRQALLPVRDLRGRLVMSKDEFDALAVGLWRDGIISLHVHDLPSALTPVERDQYVQDERGNYYIGIAPRGGT